MEHNAAIDNIKYLRFKSEFRIIFSFNSIADLRRLKQTCAAFCRSNPEQFLFITQILYKVPSWQQFKLIFQFQRNSLQELPCTPYFIFLLYLYIRIKNYLLIFLLGLYLKMILLVWIGILQTSLRLKFLILNVFKFSLCL